MIPSFLSCVQFAVRSTVLLISLTRDFGSSFRIGVVGAPPSSKAACSDSGGVPSSLTDSAESKSWPRAKASSSTLLANLKRRRLLPTSDIVD